MYHRLASTLMMPSLLLAGISQAHSETCIDFEPPAFTVGDTFSTPPPNVAFTDQGISVTLETFHYMSGGTDFGEARIVDDLAPFGATQSVNPASINLIFNLWQLGAIPELVTLRFYELDGSAGNENFSVNGCWLFRGELTGLPPDMCGIDIAVEVDPPVSGHPESGKIEIAGPVFTLMIGGQELYIDDVCVAK